MLHRKIAEFKERRARVGPLPSGSAPHVSSTMFRDSIPGATSASKARRWDHRFSIECSSQPLSALKAASSASKRSDMISLGAARLTPEYYPWQSITMTNAEFSREAAVESFQSTTTTTCSKGEVAFDLGIALNYGHAAGSPQLLRFVTEHVELVHNPPYEDWECSLTCSTTPALSMVFRIFCNRGDYVIAESSTYSGTLDCVRAQGLNILGVEMDNDGLLPDDLDQKLRDWDISRGPKPFLLYTIPSGHNPTGVTQTLERKKAIYQVAEDHDLYIIEDDPYYFIQLEGRTAGSDSGTTTRSAEEYLCGLSPSYLSLDISGRVVRMDTSSKILAPGLRCGWITGSRQVIQKFLSQADISTSSPGGLSQVMLYKLLDETWGHQGFLEWLSYLASQCRHRRDILVGACDRHLPLEICSWVVPTSGMFLWIRLDLTKHPEAISEKSNLRIQQSSLDIEDRIYTEARKCGVIVSRGSWFDCAIRKTSSIYFRLTFAAAPSDVLESGIKRFGVTLEAEFKRPSQTSHDV